MFVVLKEFFSTQQQDGANVDSGLKEFYVNPDAFQLFLKGFGNPELYLSVGRALGSDYTNLASAVSHPLRLLDIGVGDGRALIEALQVFGTSCSEPVPLVISLLEPSKMLQSCIERLQRLFNAKTHTSVESVCEPLQYLDFQTTIQQFVTSRDTDQPEWDMVQASFSLHNLPPSERAHVFRWLKTQIKTKGKLVIIEFDVPVQQKAPIFVESSAEPIIDQEFASYVFDKFSLGFQRFFPQAQTTTPGDAFPATNDQWKAIEGFLIPIMLGYFNPNQKIATFEESALLWQQELLEAGFTTVSIEKISDFWWADCIKVDASLS